MRVLGVALLFVPLLASAEIYKCVGGDGHVRFTEVPPQTGDCEPMAPGSGSVGPNDNAQSMRRFVDEADRARAEQRVQKAKTKQAQELKDERCRSARRRVMFLEQAGPTMYRMNDDGERELIGTDQRQQELDDARAQVSAHCG